MPHLKELRVRLKAKHLSKLQLLCDILPPKLEKLKFIIPTLENDTLDSKLILTEEFYTNIFNKFSRIL